MGLPTAEADGPCVGPQCGEANIHRHVYLYPRYGAYIRTNTWIVVTLSGEWKSMVLSLYVLHACNVLALIMCPVVYGIIECEYEQKQAYAYYRDI